MLCQYKFELSPWQAQELIWSRFINTRGTPGHNILEDLHQEHLNRVIKTKQNKTKPSGAHTPPSSQMDSQKSVEQLLKTEIFSETNNTHNTHNNTYTKGVMIVIKTTKQGVSSVDSTI